MRGLNIAIDDDADSETICSQMDSIPLGIEVKDLRREEFVGLLADRLTSNSQTFIKKTMEMYDVPENVILDPVIQEIVQTRISARRAYIMDNHGSRSEVDGELVEEAREFIRYLEETFKINSN